MTVQSGSRRHDAYGLLWVSSDSAAAIRDALSESCDIPRRAIATNLHLTVYHARRLLPGLFPRHEIVDITADVHETRFMVLAPGGENPQPDLEPSRRSVGIRLTKRNKATPEIQVLRSSLYGLETPRVVGSRKKTTAWTSCFGARRYQPHVKLLYPGRLVALDLTAIGSAFRSALSSIQFDRFQVKCSTVCH